MDAVNALNVSYAYPDGSLAVSDVTVSIKKGEKVGIIGANGSGKTTLIFLLSGLLPPKKGEIRILGLDPKKNAEMIRRKVGVVFQDPDDFLFNPTVKDEILYVPRQLKLSSDELERILKKYSELFELEELILKPPFRLSGGEKKKVEIASVLSYEPEIIFLDEPTANVDGKTRRKIVKIFSEFKGTLVIASHEIDVVRKICDRAVLIEKGRVVADADVRSLNDEVLETRGII